MEAASNRIIIKYGKSDTNEFVTIVFSDEVRDMLGMNDVVFLAQEGLYSSDTYSNSPLIAPKSSAKRSVANEENDTRGKREYDAVSEALDYLPSLSRTVENHPRLLDYKQAIVYVNTLLDEYKNSESLRLVAIGRLFPEQELHRMKRFYLNAIREMEADLGRNVGFSDSAVDANNPGGLPGRGVMVEKTARGVLVDVIRVPKESVLPTPVQSSSSLAVEEKVAQSQGETQQNESVSPGNEQMSSEPQQKTSTPQTSAGNEVWDQQERRWKPVHEAPPSSLPAPTSRGDSSSSSSGTPGNVSGSKSSGEPSSAEVVGAAASQTLHHRQIEVKPEIRRTSVFLHLGNEAKESMRNPIKYNSRGFGATAMRGPSFFDYPNGGLMGKQPVDITRGIHNIMIYSDVGDFVMVGDSQTQLLQNIEIPSSAKGGEQLVKRFDVPDYVPVISKFIPSVEIELKDDAGRTLGFEFGRVHVKLHFKRKHGIDT